MSSTDMNKTLYTSKTGKHSALKRQNAFNIGSLANKSRPILKRYNAMVGLQKQPLGPCHACDLPNCEFNGFNFACDDLYCVQNLTSETEEEDYDW